mmetsp:Transcript_67517/g.180422  ORF Transcript_67517/g.180422 Transcript_67517/m.180422 type:complete len:214 (+) Transcript_67517:352-993(+)
MKRRFELGGYQRELFHCKVAHCFQRKLIPAIRSASAFSGPRASITTCCALTSRSSWRGCTRWSRFSSTRSSSLLRTLSSSPWWAAAPSARSSRSARRTRASSTRSRCWTSAASRRGIRWRTPRPSGACSRLSTIPSSSPSTTPSRPAAASASSCPSSPAASSSGTCASWARSRRETRASGRPRSSWPWSTCTRWTSFTATSNPRTFCWTGRGA